MNQQHISWKVSDSFTSSCLPILLGDVLNLFVNKIFVLFQGKKFYGDLLPNGRIKMAEAKESFSSPTAWALYCKKIVNPEKRSRCGWGMVSIKNTLSPLFN